MSKNDYGNYSVKKVKTFEGTDGYGYNADLYRDGKKVARVIDDGGGGEASFYWEDHDAKKVNITRTDWRGDKHAYKGTPEEKLLTDQVEKQPLQESEYRSDGLRMDESWFVSDLVSIFEGATP